MEEERRGKEGSSKGERFEFQRKGKEKEKEKEERKEGEERSQGERGQRREEWRHLRRRREAKEDWWKKRCQKVADPMLWGHRDGSGPPCETKGDEEGQEKDEEDKRRELQQWERIRHFDFERRGGAVVRQEQDPPAIDHCAGGPDQLINRAYEAVFGDCRRSGMGTGLDPSAPAGVALQSAIHVEPPHRGSASGVHDVGFSDGPSSSRSVLRSLRRSDTADEVNRDVEHGHTLGYQPESGACAPSRAEHGIKAGKSVGKEGGQVRLRCKRRRWKRTQRERTRQDEGQKQRQDEEQREGKRRRKEAIIGEVREQRKKEADRGYELPRRGSEEEEEEGSEDEVAHQDMSGQHQKEEKSRRKSLEEERRKEDQERSSRITGEKLRKRSRITGEKHNRASSRIIGEKNISEEGVLKNSKSIEEGLRQKGSIAMTWTRTATDDEIYPGAAAATAIPFSPEAIYSNEQACEDSLNSGLGRDHREKGVESEPASAGTLLEIFKWLFGRMDEYLDKTLPTGRIFPLPSSFDLLGQLFPQSSKDARYVLSCVVLALNSLNGEGLRGSGMASELQRSVLSGLLEDCERVALWEGTVKVPSCDEFLRVRGVDYKGDEVLTAQT